MYSLISIRQNYNFYMLATIDMKLLLDFWRFLRISQDLRNMITKLFLFFIFISVQNNFMITISKNWQKRGKNHKSTSTAMSNDCSSIKIIDRSHEALTCMWNYHKILTLDKSFMQLQQSWSWTFCGPGHQSRYL